MAGTQVAANRREKNMQFRKITISSAAKSARPPSRFFVAAIVVVGVALAGAGVTPAKAEQDEVPFEWDHEFSSPGKSLTVKVLQTMRGPPQGMVTISITSSGFSAADGTLVLWQKIGGKYRRYNPEIGADGTVQIIPGVDSMMLGGYRRGQSFDIALVNETTNERAHAKATPFPIMAQGNGACTASAEIQMPSGLLWLVSLAGYDAGEQVKITSVAKKETLSDTLIASETGNIAFPILYAKRSKGTARVVAEGSSGCNVTIEYAIGKSARKAK